MEFLERWEALDVSERRDLFGSAGTGTAADPGDRRRATATQGAILGLELEAGEVSPYTIGYAFDLSGPYDDQRLVETVNATVRHHAILRTRYLIDDRGQVMSELSDEEFAVVVEDVVSADARVAELAAAPLGTSEGVVAIDTVFSAWLLRASGSTPDVLVLKAHHIAVDGQSMGALVDEIIARYAGTYADEGTDQFRGLQEAGVVSEADLSESAERWWRDYLGTAAAAMLPTEATPTTSNRFIGGHRSFLVPARTWRGAVEAAGEAGAGAAALSLLVVAAVVARYTGDWDANLGLSVAGRSSARVMSVIGPFADSVPVRVELDPRERAVDAASRLVDGPGNGRLEHEAPFSRIVRALQPPRREGHNPIYNVLVTLDAEDGPKERQVVPGVTFVRRELLNETARVPFQVTVSSPTGQGTRLRLDYARGYYSDAFMEQVGRDLVQGFADLADGVRVGDLGRRDPGGLLVGAETSRSGDVVDRFWESVDVRGEQAAVRRGDEVLSYRELAAAARELAAELTEAQAGVAVVSVEHGADLVVTLLACLISGTAYVPVSSDLPPLRVEAMSRVTCADTAIRGSVPGGFTVSPWPGREPESRKPQAMTGAYAMFTSGSTGEPKAVWVGREALSHYCGAAEDAGLVRPDERVLALTSPTFDISIDELLLPLLVGATTVFSGNGPGLLGVSEAVTLVNSGGVDVVHGTPSLMLALIADGWDPAAQVRRIVVGGERLVPEVAEQLLGRSSEVLNVYGPTEATVWATAARLDVAAGNPPLGAPLAGYRIRVVAPHGGAEVAAGEVGEVLIGGPALAEGYGNAPELTAERFPDLDGERWYVTGDLARVVAGSLHFVGRRDSQVKVRGHRLELGELETVASSLPGVIGAAAAADDDQVFVLVRGAVDESTLRAEFAARLPRAVQPDIVGVTADPLPLTPNGKLDRAAVKREALRVAVVTAEHQTALSSLDSSAPEDPERAEFESWVKERWEMMLQRPLTRTSNLFDSGGHSLLLARTAAMARSELGLRVPISDLYSNPSPAGVAALLHLEALRVLSN